jgi:hypothetical protein
VCCFLLPCVILSGNMLCDLDILLHIECHFASYTRQFPQIGQPCATRRNCLSFASFFHFTDYKTLHRKLTIEKHGRPKNGVNSSDLRRGGEFLFHMWHPSTNSIRWSCDIHVHIFGISALYCGCIVEYHDKNVWFSFINTFSST